MAIFLNVHKLPRSQATIPGQPGRGASNRAAKRLSYFISQRMSPLKYSLIGLTDIDGRKVQSSTPLPAPGRVINRSVEAGGREFLPLLSLQTSLSLHLSLPPSLSLAHIYCLLCSL